MDEAALSRIHRDLTLDGTVLVALAAVMWRLPGPTCLCPSRATYVTLQVYRPYHGWTMDELAHTKQSKKMQWTFGSIPCRPSSYWKE